MEYRESHSGYIYRRGGATNDNEMLTPWGCWVRCTFLPGASGWALIVRLTHPIALNPDWPA